MKLHIKDRTNWERNMEEEHLHGEIEKVRRQESRKHIWENFKMICSMDKEDMNGQMVEYMMESGRKEKWKEKVNSFGQVYE